MLQAKWQNFIFRFTLWLLMEILLSYLGLDNMADYSEFFFERHRVTIAQPN